MSTVLTGGGLKAAERVTGLAINLKPKFITNGSISCMIRAVENRGLTEVVAGNTTVPGAKIPNVVKKFKGRHILRTPTTKRVRYVSGVTSVIRGSRILT